MRSVIYTRQSLALAGDDLAVSRQEAECLKLAERRGWGRPEVFCDNSYSASKPDSRPAYKRLLRLMAERQVQNVIILRIDRLMRLNDELEELIKLSEGTGVRVITVEGDIDLSTTQGRLIARILVSVARNEIEVKSERHKLSNQQRAVSGLPHKGRRAFGYELDGLTIREDEAAVLRDMADKFLSGWSYNELTRWVNEQGHRTAMGNEFVGVAIRQMLTRKRYAGIREHDGVDYPAQWPAIFDADTWARLQYTMRERSETNGRPMPRRHLLTGLLVCGGCGATMNGTTTYDRKTGEPRKTYRCNRARKTPDGKPGCGKVSRGAVPLDHFIRELIVFRLDTPALAELLTGDKRDQIAPLLSERDTLTTKLDELVDDFADGTLDKAGYRRASDRVRARLAGVEDEIDRLHRSQFHLSLEAGQTVADAWDANEDGWRRTLIEMLVEKITVNPTGLKPRYKVGEKTFYFDHNAIDIRWRY